MTRKKIPVERSPLKTPTVKYDFDELIEREGTNSVKYDLRKHIFGNRNVQPMWVADMDFATPPFIREAIINKANHPVYGYSFRSPTFNHSVKTWMKKRFSWEIKSDWLAFSPGVVPAINLCVLAFTKPGDTIVVQPPVYFPFFTAIKNHGRKILYNQLVEKENRYFIDFKDFEKKMKRASMFIFCHPHNPVGRVWTLEELKKITDICLKHEVLIISDEIHADLVLNNNRHIPLAMLNKEVAENTITCISPSKTFNLAGLSTSALIIPDKTRKARYDEVLENIHVGSGNVFGTVALEAAYSQGEDWLFQLLSYLEGNLAYLHHFLNSRIPELVITPTEATYLVWIDFRKLGMNHKKLNNFLINRAGLGLSSGTLFGPGGEGFQRMNIAVPRARLQEALHKLEEAIAALRKENEV